MVSGVSRAEQMQTHSSLAVGSGRLRRVRVELAQDRERFRAIHCLTQIVVIIPLIAIIWIDHQGNLVLLRSAFKLDKAVLHGRHVLIDIVREVVEEVADLVLRAVVVATWDGHTLAVCN